MDNKLRRFLQTPIESSPVWLDEGRTIAYIRHDEAGSRIWQMNMETGEKVCRTTEDVRIWSIKSLPETGDIYYATDSTGSECEQIFRLRPGETGGTDVTGTIGARHFLGGVMPDRNTLAYACNKRDKRTFDIWKKNMATGEAAMVKQHSDNYNWPCSDALSPDGRYMLYNKLRGENDNALWMTDMVTGETRRIPEDGIISAETEPAWKHDSQGFYLLSDRGGDFIGVYYYDIAAGRMESVYSYGWDAAALAVSCDDKYLAVTVNAGGYTELHIYDIQAKAELNPPRPPKGVLSNYQQMSWSPVGHKLLFTLTSGKRPEGIWMLDIDAERLERISEKTLNDEDERLLVEPISCSFESFDGLKVPYWLYVPYGKEPKDLPIVIEIHGGPEGQETPAFNEFIQYLLSEGIAVAAPNVRGSTGYGKTYTHIDDVDKRLDSVRDIDSLFAHLIKTGTAREGKLAVTGTSYGGFMTLSCAARYPELWACAIDTVGMYDLVTFLENTAEYRRAHRESEYGSLTEHYDILKAVSPAAKIADISAPIMIIQGRNDPRVPVTEAEQAVAALRALGRTVEYLCYDDEGHGIAKLKNKLDCYPKMAAFLKKYLF